MRSFKKIAAIVIFIGVGLAAYAISCTRNKEMVAAPELRPVDGTNDPGIASDIEERVREARAVLTKADFKAKLDAAQVCLDDPDDPIHAPFDPVYDRLKPVESYSRGERMLLCGWRDDKGGHENLCATFDLLRQHYDRFGFLPSDGADLAAWVEVGLRRGSVEQLNELLAGPDALSRFGYAINPVTARFYASFDRDEWQPGGVYFKPDLPFDELEAAFAGRFGFENCQGPDFKGAWLVKVFGDAPQEVLAFKPLVMLDSSMQPRTRELAPVREAPAEWKH